VSACHTWPFKFAVALNAWVLQNFDIFAQAGANAAVVESFNTNGTKGQMAIEFDSSVQNPKINAIEILPMPSAPLLALNSPTPTARRSAVI